MAGSTESVSRSNPRSGVGFVIAWGFSVPILDQAAELLIASRHRQTREVRIDS